MAALSVPAARNSLRPWDGGRWPGRRQTPRRSCDGTHWRPTGRGAPKSGPGPRSCARGEKTWRGRRLEKRADELDDGEGGRAGGRKVDGVCARPERHTAESEGARSAISIALMRPTLAARANDRHGRSVQRFRSRALSIARQTPCCASLRSHQARDQHDQRAAATPATASATRSKSCQLAQ